jgi:hypothetical protein
MTEPSQSEVAGIIVGFAILGVFFMLFVMALFHWYSRRMHRTAIVIPPPSESNGAGEGSVSNSKV